MWSVLRSKLFWLALLTVLALSGGLLYVSHRLRYPVDPESGSP